MNAIIRYQAPLEVSGADSDAGLIDLWLEGKTTHTRRAYERETQRFLEVVAKPLATVTLADLYAFQRTLAGSTATVARAMASVKSLLSFGQKVGYLPFNVGAAVRLQAPQNALAERILSEPDIHRMLALEPDRRNHALLRFLYVTGLRVNEAVSLRWRNMVPDATGGGLLNVHGKGGKTRVVRVPTAIWDEVWALGDGDREPERPVFVSQKGGPLDPSAVHRVVRLAAVRAGIAGAVSPHWLRHAHASHSLDRGAPISLVQATLGHSTVATTGRYLHARPEESSGNYLSV